MSDLPEPRIHIQRTPSDPPSFVIVREESLSGPPTVAFRVTAKASRVTVERHMLDALGESSWVGVTKQPGGPSVLAILALFDALRDAAEPAGPDVIDDTCDGCGERGCDDPACGEEDDSRERCGICAPGNTVPCHAVNAMFMCTRERGHEGSHVACGSIDHAIHAWSDPEEPKRRPDPVDPTTPLPSVKTYPSLAEAFEWLDQRGHTSPEDDVRDALVDAGVDVDADLFMRVWELARERGYPNRHADVIDTARALGIDPDKRRPRVIP